MTRTQCYGSYAKTQLIRRVTRANECDAFPQGFFPAVSTCWVFSLFAWLCLLPFEYKSILISIIRSVTLHLCTWEMQPFISPYTSHTTPNHSSTCFQAFCHSFSSQPSPLLFNFSRIFHFYSLFHPPSFVPVVPSIFFFASDDKKNWNWCLKN